MSIIMGIGKRGCGYKQDGGLYACVGLSEHGTPIEEFVVDPPRLWQGGAFRAPEISTRSNGINDMVMYVGESHYATIPDYIEEVIRMGVSKRIPEDFPVEALTPGRSRIILVHAKARPNFLFECLGTSPHCKQPDTPHPCTFNLWPLAGLDAIERGSGKQEDSGKITVTIPSCSYTVTPPAVLPEVKVSDSSLYDAGVFLALPLSHFEVCSIKANPDKQVARVRSANWHVRVVDEEGNEKTKETPDA